MKQKMYRRDICHKHLMFTRSSDKIVRKLDFFLKKEWN